MSKRKEPKHTISDLYQMQSLPLDMKIRMTRRRIREWVDRFGEDGVYVSFSGGKDSTVLLDIVRKDYPNIEAVFVNTGLEYPSVRNFAESKENVTVLRPKINFKEVLSKYGYPIIGKEVSATIYEARKGYKYRIKQLNGEKLNKDGTVSQYNMDKWRFLMEAPILISDLCCDVMKKQPVHNYSRKENKNSILATMAGESRLRTSSWLINGCNAFEAEYPRSAPMSFWTEKDILTYIHTYNLAIADAYGQVVVDYDAMGLVEGQIDFFEYIADLSHCKIEEVPGFDKKNIKYCTTGCKRTGCIFCGFGITQDKDRFIRLSEQEPKLCDYVMRGGAFDTDGMWKPTNDGLGYWFVLEWLNLHGLGIGIPNRNHYLCKYSTQQTSGFLDN